jgi:hypothetical protein
MNSGQCVKINDSRLSGAAAHGALLKLVSMRANTARASKQADNPKPIAWQEFESIMNEIAWI